MVSYSFRAECDSSDVGMYYNSICLTDSLHIWFIGDHRVYRSVDGGINCSYSETEDLFLSIWFNLNIIGMASGGEKAYLSVDLGKTRTYDQLWEIFMQWQDRGRKIIGLQLIHMFFILVMVLHG